MMMQTRLLITLLMTALVLPTAWAQEAEQADETTEVAKLAAPTDSDWSVTEHEVTIDGKAVAYTATAGTIQLKDAKEKAKASMFFIAYTAKHEGKPQERPVMFCFNGGPGTWVASARVVSIWMRSATRSARLMT